MDVGRGKAAGKVLVSDVIAEGAVDRVKKNNALGSARRSVGRNFLRAVELGLIGIQRRSPVVPPVFPPADVRRIKSKADVELVIGSGLPGIPRHAYYHPQAIEPVGWMRGDGSRVESKPRFIGLVDELQIINVSLRIHLHRVLVARHDAGIDATAVLL